MILFLSFLEVSLPVHETHLMKRIRSEHNCAMCMALNIVKIITNLFQTVLFSEWQNVASVS